MTFVLERPVMQPPELLPSPPTYDPEFAEEARKCALARASDEALARHFEIPLATFHEWLASVPEFARAVRYGRKLGDIDMVDRLHKNGMGFTHPAVKIFRPLKAEEEPLCVPYTQHHRPDTPAGKFWLVNRLPDQWRLKVEIEVKPSHDNVRNLPNPQLDRLIVELAAGRASAAQGHSSGLPRVVPPAGP
jgi:hypothetical protein